MNRLYSVVAALLIASSASAQYQVANSDFEQWEAVSAEAQEPTGWNSYLSAVGSHAALVNNQGTLLLRSNDVRPGSKGQYSAQIMARNLLTKNLYGNLTTGGINVDGMNPGDGAHYYNFTNPQTNGQAMRFSGRPDSVRVWTKLSATTGNNGLVSVILHTDGTYKTPIVEGDVFQSTATAVAQAVQQVTANGKWTAYSLPLGYSSQTAVPAYALISFQTSNVPGKGDKEATMLIDDMEFVYNSELASVTYAGKNILGQTEIDAKYEASKMGAIRANGVSATVESDFNEETLQLTITVKGGDIDVNPTNVHVYTFQFKDRNPGEEPEVHEWPEAGTLASYEDALQVTVNSVTNPAQQYTINLQYKEEGMVTLSLNNFVLESAGDMIPIGNISLDDIQLEWNAEKAVAEFSKTENVYITAGTLAEYTFWMGPMLNSMYGAIPVTMTGCLTAEKLFVNIYINMMDTSLRQMIYVTFGEDFTDEPGDNPDKPGDNPDLGYTPLPTSGHKVYSDDLYVQINEAITGPLDADVTVTFHEGTIDFALYDFALKTEDGDMPVGNIYVPGLPITHEGDGVYSYSFHDILEISAGTYDTDEWGDPVDWLGPMLGPLTLGLDGKISVDKIYVTIDIPLEGLGQMIHVTFGKDEFETAIKNIEAKEKQNGESYDLSGRRTATTLHGKVYIVNGKKVIK